MEREKSAVITKNAGSEEVVTEEGGSSCAGDTFEGDDQTVDHHHHHPPDLCRLADHPPSDLRLIATVAASSASKQMLLHTHSQEAAVLTVLGGKASCRRKFVLNLQLQDADGHVVPRDLSIIASVAFASDHSPVRPPDTGEPPLFTTFNGIEFSAHDNPTRMLAGHATFKLAISLLSSKYENRLFCICFSPQITKPPLCAPCFSSPIRSISRKRTAAAIQVQHVVNASHTDPSTLFHLPQTYTASRPFRAHSPNHSSSDNNISTIYSTGAAHLIHNVAAQGNSTANSAVAALQQQNMMAQLMLNSSSTATPVTCRLNTPSPVDSGRGSPNSAATLTSESGCCIDNQAHYVNCLLHNGVNSCTTLQASLSRPLSAPSPPVSCARPLRPHASIGVCKLPFMRSSVIPIEGSRIYHSLQEGVGAVSNGIHANGPGAAIAEEGPEPDGTDEAAELQSRSFAVGVMQHVSSVAGLAMPVRQRIDALMRSFLGSSSRMQSGGLEDNRAEGAQQDEAMSQAHLEEEERALQYLELSLYEVSLDIQKRKEQVQLKRRRLLEDEARLHNFIFSQSSSWINTLATKLSHH